MNEPIEIFVIEYLTGKDLSVGPQIYAEVPAENIPEKYLLVEKTGSSRVNRIEQAMVAIRSVSRNRQQGMLDVIRLNAEVKKAMDEIIERDEIFRCECNSDHNFTNTQTKEYRYQAVFNLYY